MTRQELFTWIRQQYGTEPEYPWHDWNAVLRHNDNNKWYGVVLEYQLISWDCRRQASLMSLMWKAIRCWSALFAGRTAIFRPRRPYSGLVSISFFLESTSVLLPSHKIWPARFVFCLPFVLLSFPFWGFGTLPNKLFCRAKYGSGYTLPMLATVTLSSYSPSTNTTILNKRNGLGRIK